MKRNFLSPVALALFSAIALPFSAHAAGVLTGTVMLNTTSGLYDYSYSVQNTSATDDIILVTFSADPMSSLVGLSAPTGFNITFDPSQGWVNFTEDFSVVTDQTFAPGTTVAPFTFSSAYAPGLVNYTISDFTGDTMGSVQAPFSAPVPEPSGLFLSTLAAAGFVLRRRR